MKRRVVGVVLAGGASRRFGSDKLGADLGGRPLIVHVLDALRRAPVDAVVLAGPAEPATPAWLEDAVGLGARLVRDREPSGGPLVALANALADVDDDDIALVVGGDMPWLEPTVLADLALAAGEDGIVAACLVADGRDEQLPLALRAGSGRAAAADLVAGGERRLGALLDVLGGRVRRLQADRRVVRDVDTVADMEPAGADEAPAGGERGTRSQRAG